MWMSISDISGMSKALSDFEGIGSALREANGFMDGITGAIPSISRTYGPMLSDDEVSYCPAAWQQAVCTP